MRETDKLHQVGRLLALSILKLRLLRNDADRRQFYIGKLSTKGGWRFLLSRVTRNKLAAYWVDRLNHGTSLGAAAARATFCACRFAQNWPEEASRALSFAAAICVR